MHNRMHKDGPAIWLMALALATPGTAADQEPTDEELSEVVVTGRRAGYVLQDPQPYFNWLARLVGEFTVEGYVDVSPRGGPRDALTVEGTAHCIGFGVAPGVQCDLSIRWPLSAATDGKEIPGGAPTLDPALMLLGARQRGYNYHPGEFEITNFDITYSLVDNRGIFESGKGVLDGEDTVVTTSHCAAVRADCERMVRITAAPDLRTVEMLIELTIEQHRTIRQVLLMNRVPGSKAQVFGREPGKEVRK